MQDSKPISTPLTPYNKGNENEEDCHDARKYRSLVGGLLYIAATRPDISFAASYLSRYMQRPKHCHYKEAQRINEYFAISKEQVTMVKLSSKLQRQS